MIEPEYDMGDMDDRRVDARRKELPSDLVGGGLDAMGEMAHRLRARRLNAQRRPLVRWRGAGATLVAAGVWLAWVLVAMLVFACSIVATLVAALVVVLVFACSIVGSTLDRVGPFALAKRRGRSPFREVGPGEGLAGVPLPDKNTNKQDLFAPTDRNCKCP